MDAIDFIDCRESSKSLKNENPDLLCLQEVDRGVPRSRLHDQPKLLAEQFFSAGCTFQLNVRLKKGGYGNLLLARWSFAERHSISLGAARKKSAGYTACDYRFARRIFSIYQFTFGSWRTGETSADTAPALSSSFSSQRSIAYDYCRRHK